MITATKTNTIIKVESFTDDKERKALKKLLTFAVPNFRFMTSYRKGVWDGTYSFWNDYSMTFPAGLFSILPEQMKKRFIFKDACKVICNESVFPPPIRTFQLRDYQLQAIKEALEKKKCIITAPTNAGKTIIGAAISASIKSPVLWITHRGNLMYQTKEKFEAALGEKVGIIHRDIMDIQRVTIGMVQTLANRLSGPERIKKFLKEYMSKEVDVLFIDECHHGSATTFYKVAKACDAYWRFGLSATPLMREEIQNLRLIAITGEEIKTITNKELIERGISAKPVVYRVKNWPIRFITPKNWMSSYEIGIETNTERNSVIARIVRKHKERKEPVLILVNTFRHAHHLMSLLGEDAKLVCGNTESLERNRMLRELESNKIPALIATPLFDEGVDAPNIKVLILASAGKSHLRLLQRLGRGMRKKEDGRNILQVYDFEDRGDKYLEGHAIYRHNLYVKEGFDIIPTNIEEIP